MSKTPALYISHILTCINAILSYTQNMDEETFLSNKLVQDAVLRNGDAWQVCATNLFTTIWG
jgi:uncharacterized protein with HEPN domain